MDRSRWQQILDSVPAPDGEWVKLPGIPRSALVAFVAGPGNVRPILPDLTAPVVRTEQIGPDGTAVQSRRPLDEDDVADLRDAVSSYLTDIGLPDPGVLASWEVRVPAGMTPEALPRVIEEADTAPPITDDPVRDSLASARSVAAAASRLWGVPNPLQESPPA